MKTILRIFSFALWVILVGLWPADAAAQVGGIGPCVSPSLGNIFGPLPGGAAVRAAMIKRTIRCLRASGQAPATGAAAGNGRFITFDPPGSTFTNPSAIAADRTITGYYIDASGVQHGFVRTPTGSFTTFDPPGSTLTQPTSIAPTGEIAGIYCVTAAPGCAFGFAPNHGFVRASNGTFTTFDAPVPNIFASIYTLFGGAPPSINPAGAIAGTYFDASSTEHGFQRAGNGALTTVDAPGALSTEVLAINPSGLLVGDSFNSTTSRFLPFLRAPDGSFTTIDSPDFCFFGFTIPTGGINPAGAVAGSAEDPSCSIPVGFLRTPDGKVTTFSVPGGIVFVDSQAINPAGAIAGAFLVKVPFQTRGFLRTPDGTLTAFDVAGSFATWATGINASGVITGWWLDANGAAHGFLRLP
jgi:hypothetical protein